MFARFMIQWIIFLFIILISRINGACWCPEEHPQTLHCESQVVIEVEEVHPLSPPDLFLPTKEIIYEGRVVQVHKGEELLGAVPKQKFIANGKLSSCGAIELNPLAKYLIYAVMTTDGLKIRKCNGVRTMDETVRPEIKNIKDYDCSCSTNVSPPDQTDHGFYIDKMIESYASPDTCLSPPETTCEYQEGVCTRNGDTFCSWVVVGLC